LLENTVKGIILDNVIQDGIKEGSKNAVKGTATSLWNAATSPVATLQSTWFAVTHPIKTYDVLKHALIQSFEKNMVHGNAYTRSRWVTYAFVTFGLSVFGTKGINKVSKAAKAGKISESAVKARTVTKATLTKHAESVNNKLGEWNNVLSPSIQFANGHVPFNVIDSKGLKSKLQNLPDRDNRFTSQINHVRDLIQQASAKKVGSLAKGTVDIRKTSQTFGQPIETIFGGKKIKLRIDAEPAGNKIQIQAGKGKKSEVDIRINLNLPLEKQIPKNLKRSLTVPQYKELLNNLQKAVEYLK
jgi:predicted ribonuclease toxin of YeeF-YezG toxin-antitoxin module